MGTPLLDVVITGQPCGKARHRTRFVQPKGRPGFVSSYVDPKDPNVSWERFASAVFSEAWGGRPPLGRVPLRLIVEAIATRPKGMKKSAGQGRLWRLAKPDGDNVLKAIADALQAGGVVLDDKVIAHMSVVSLVAADGEAPHTRVVLEELEPLPLVEWPAKPKKQTGRRGAPAL